MLKADVITSLIKDEAIRLGFLDCTFSHATKLEEESHLLETWLRQEKHGEMKWMEKYFDMRTDPRVLLPGAKSVVMLSYNYFPNQSDSSNITGEKNYQVSKYALGRDYHEVIREKLKELVYSLTSKLGEFAGRVFVDSGPVMEKAWATRSGLGWQGKNTNIIHPKKGSFFFLASLITDLPVIADVPMMDYCGTCTRCIDACPTNAIVAPNVLDATKCISYFTIELKGSIPPEMEEGIGSWIFGCDICQDVCPWNRFSKPHQEPQFSIENSPNNLSDHQWEEMTEEVFNSYFKGSPLRRTKYEGMKRNVSIARNNQLRAKL